ncbi:hypothetical protein [uncultured Paraglaciecola sp.]|uniref:hypothetical protein n=1 Tax=uncultured Paraglaciecola sp. TaxID=1765024 RepID=UPI0026100ECE|nr:hypothetical protein [uncultured Paraglaciecola sp.]
MDTFKTISALWLAALRIQDKEAPLAESLKVYRQSSHWMRQLMHTFGLTLLPNGKASGKAQNVAANIA